MPPYTEFTITVDGAPEESELIHEALMDIMGICNCTRRKAQMQIQTRRPAKFREMCQPAPHPYHMVYSAMCPYGRRPPVKHLWNKCPDCIYKCSCNVTSAEFCPFW